jgi:membrane protein implicated in regulation of membrane protease activity
MSEDKSPVATMIDAHEEWLRRMNATASRTKNLSIITIVAAGLLTLAYAAQFVLSLTGTAAVVVQVSSPILIAFQGFILILVVLWLYTGLDFYRFTSRLKKQVARAQEEEAELERRIGGSANR